MLDFSHLNATLDRLHLSRHTQTAYIRVWKRFAAWLTVNSHSSLENLPKAEIEAFFATLAANKSASTQIQILAALNFIFKSYSLPSPFAHVQRPPASALNTAIRYMEPSSLAKLITFLKNNRKGYYDHLVYVLTLTLFNTATRFFELVNLSWEQCERAGDRVVSIRIKGKGNQFATLPINGIVSEALSEWAIYQENVKGLKIRSRRGISFCASDKIFAGFSGEPITNQMFNKRLKIVCAALGISPISSHIFRHSAATGLLNSRMDISLKDIQEMLRHKSIATTARYAHVTPDKMRKTFGALEDFIHEKAVV